MADATALIDIIKHLEAPRHFFRPICDNLKQLADRLDSPHVHPYVDSDSTTGGIQEVIFRVPQDKDGRLFHRLNAEQFAESTSDDARVIPYLSDILQGHLQKLHAAKQELDVALGRVPQELLVVLDAHCGRPWLSLVRQTVVDAILLPPRECSLSNDKPGWVPKRVTDALEYAKRVDLETHWGEVEREIEQRTREVAAVRDSVKSSTQKTGKHGAKPNRSKSKDDSNTKSLIIAALNEHHQYSNGECEDVGHVGVNKLACHLKLSPSTVSGFFKTEFGGHAKYRRACSDTRTLAKAFVILNGELTPGILYNSLGDNDGNLADE